jgi:glycosyltransferase involved in cell wall biosynthesis
LKLIYFIDNLWKSGGTERVLTTKVNWLATHGHDVMVVTLLDTRPSFFALCDKVQRVFLSADHLSPSSYLDEVRNIVNNQHPDVCIATAGLAVGAIWKLKDSSLKVLEFHYTKNFLVNFVNGLTHIHFKQLHLLKMRYLQWQLARTARHYDAFVGLTARDVKLWGEPRNMTYVHNPLSFTSEAKSTCENMTIVSVGSWTPAKGMDQLLEAFGPLASKYPEWRVELYGSGQDEALLRSIIAKYSMENQVQLHPPVLDIASKLVQASIYAFPSRSDGFGLVITEAMECGLPTVAMDCPCGPCEIVTPETGLVVPEKDIVAFRKALQRLMDSLSLRKSMGREALQRVKYFYPDAIMPQWIQLFQDLKKNRKNRT